MLIHTVRSGTLQAAACVPQRGQKATVIAGVDRPAAKVLNSGLGEGVFINSLPLPPARRGPRSCSVAESHEPGDRQLLAAATAGVPSLPEHAPNSSRR